MSDMRERLIDRLKLTSAWVAEAMEPTRPGEPEPEFCPLATVEDAIATLSALPAWRPIPAEVVEGVEPWTGDPVLLGAMSGNRLRTGVGSYSMWKGTAILWDWPWGFDPTHYALIAPLPPAEREGR